MKKIWYLLLLSTSSIYAQTVESNQVETIYTEAIDARYAGDLAKSRNLLEQLKENNFTNEYVMTLLIEVYEEYLVNLINNKDKEVLNVAYPGIRKNIAEIWDLFPQSELIQNQGLKIAWMLGDVAMGRSMVELVLSENPNHFMANYFAGLYLFTPDTYSQSVVYFRKIAHTDRIAGKEQFIFQSSVYLGDIYLEQNQQLKALKYYYKALEIVPNIDLVAKLAVLETYQMNYTAALTFFQSIPLSVMTLELFDAYFAALWGEGSQESLVIMSHLLSQNPSQSFFSQSLIQASLGRTQKALRLLHQEEFIKKEMPGSYSALSLNLATRLGDLKEIALAKKSLGIFFYNIDQNENALFFLKDLDSSLDDDGEMTFVLGKIAQEEFDFVTAKKYFLESLTGKKDLNIYTELIKTLISLKDFPQAERYLSEAQNEISVSPVWHTMIEGFIAYSEEQLEKAESLIKEVYQQFPDDVFVNHLLASVYIKQEKYEEAEKLILHVYQMDPSIISSQNSLAYFYSSVDKNMDEALNLALKVVAEDDDLLHLDTLAWVYIVREELDQAGEIVIQIENRLNELKSHIGLEEIYVHLGVYYNRIGKEVQSKEYFETARFLNPQSKYVEKYAP